MHNGSIADFSSVKRDLTLAVEPGLFPEIEGSTDSELFFYLALTFGLEQDPPAAVSRAVGLIEEPFLIFGVAIGTEDAVGDAVAEATERLRRALGPTLKPQAIPNFVGTTPQAAATYAPSEPDRLRALKRRVDPDGLLRFHPPLPLPD